MRSNSYSAWVGFLCLCYLALMPSAWAADVTAQVSVSNLTLVSSTRVGRTLFDYTYKITLTNSGGALTGVTATVTSAAPATQIADGTVAIDSLGAGAAVSPADTITIRQDRLTTFNAALLHWSVSGSPAAGSVVGVILEGAPNSPADNALFFRIGESPDVKDVVDGLVTTRLMAAIDPDATVAMVNAALALVNGRITTMAPEGGLVDIAIPPVAGPAGAEAVAQQLLATGAFVVVSPTYVRPILDQLPKDWLPPPLSTDKGVDYLKELRAPATWNIRDWLNGLVGPGKVKIKIADLYFNTTHRDLAISFVGNSGEAGDENHGWHVAGTIAATFDKQDATGVHPSTQYLDVTGLRFYNFADSWINRINKITSLFSYEESFVLNTSLGFNDPNNTIKSYIKAVSAITWRERTAAKQNAFIHLASAGNDNDKPGGPYSAHFNSPWNIAAKFSNPCLAFDELSGSELAKCQKKFDNEIVGKNLPELKNVIIIGSKKPEIDELSVFSNLNEDIVAVGEEVRNICVQNEPIKPPPANQNPKYYCPGPNSLVSYRGTSMATPQVAGIAALLWTIKPSLSVAELKAIINNSPVPTAPKSKVRLVDAYNSILAIDEAAEIGKAPVRTALLDVVGVNGGNTLPDGAFTYADFLAFVEEFAKRIKSGAAATPDYSRYDLNGDGYTGGSRTTAFNLDIDYSNQAPIYKASIKQEADGISLYFNEFAVSDLDVLCYYAYTPLFPTADRAKIQTAFDLVNSIYGTQLSCGGMEVLVKSGDPGGPFGNSFSAFDSKVSVNNNGAVAFSGLDAASASAGYVAFNAGQSVTRMTFEGAFSSRRFAGASINNNEVPDAAFRELLPGSPPKYFVRRWRSPGEFTVIARSSGVIGGMCVAGARAGQSCFTDSDCPSSLFPFLTEACSMGPAAPIDSATFWLNLNDNGLVAFLGLVNGSTQSALFAGKNEADLLSLRKFPVGTNPGIRPQVANTDDIVYFDGSSAVNVVHHPSGTSDIVSSSFVVTSDRPGISADGSYVVFAGSKGGIPGVYLVRRNPDYYDWQLVDTTGSAATAEGVFTTFTPSTRYAVSVTPDPDDPTFGTSSITVVFAGTRSYLPVGGSLITREGVYRLRVSVNELNNTLTKLGPPEIIVEKTGILAVNGKTVASFDLWDPLSDDGRYVALWVSFTDGTSGILRAR